jgi:hypothetical protein
VPYRRTERTNPEKTAIQLPATETTAQTDPDVTVTLYVASTDAKAQADLPAGLRPHPATAVLLVRVGASGEGVYVSWVMRTSVPAGSRNAQSRTPYGWSVGSWTTSAPVAWTVSNVPSTSGEPIWMVA